MKKLLLTFLVGLLSLPAFAADGDDFSYTYEGQTLTYTILSEADKTVKTKESTSIWTAGNYIYGDLILPEKVQYNGSEYTLTEISDWAFYDCDGLTSVEIPNSVTSIGGSAFYGCTGLKKVGISDIAAWCGIQYGNFEANPLYCAHHLYMDGEEVTDLVIPETVTSIGNIAFYGCTGLTSVEIPNSVTSIGDGAFLDCTGLTSVGIPSSVTSIGNYAFFYCIGLTRITIPNSVTSIGEEAFYGCTGLTSVTIPNSVTSIGDNAFRGCTGLKTIELKSVTPPNYYFVFDSFKNTSTLIIPDGTFVDYINSDWQNFLSIKDMSGTEFVPFNDQVFTYRYMPNSGEAILVNNANYSSMTSASIADRIYVDEGEAQGFYKVTRIAPDAFKNCTGLTSVIIPSSVTLIDESAFSNCTNLKEVAIGCGVKEIGENVFGSAVENIYITATEAPDAEDNSVANYNANLWLTPGCSNNYKYATNCWWRFNNLKELVVPTDFTASRSEVAAETGKQVRVGAIFTPEDVTLPYYEWYSTNPKAATVDQNGLITIVDGSVGCDIVALNLYETNNMAVIKVNGGQMGVEDITFDSDSESPERPNDIYTMQGVCLKRNASQEDVDALAPGLYIIGGEKILVK